MKAFIVTLGCKVNQFESSAMVESLEKAGYKIAKTAEDLNLIVLNTCTVTHKAENQSLAVLKKITRANPLAKVVVTGCLAQSNPSVLEETGLVNLVLGQTEKANLHKYLAEETLETEKTKVLVSAIEGEAKNFGYPKPERTRVFFKIQDGCSMCCSYCAVPSSRGKSRSLGLELVLEGLRNYLNLGIREIVFCGIHLGHYGLDLSPKINLAQLLHIIASEIVVDEESFRLRLSSIEPLEVTSEIFEAYEMYPWLARHFHLPLQSGSNRILKAMKRPYTREEFKNLILNLKTKWPQMALGVDIMAGYPSETEEDFLESYNLIKELPITYLHVFPYSIRKNTPAALSLEQIPEEIKKERVLKLKKLSVLKRQAFENNNLNSVQTALVENAKHKASGRYKVLTDNYLGGLLPINETRVTPGELVTVYLTASNNKWNFLEASLI